MAIYFEFYCTSTATPIVSQRISRVSKFSTS